MNLRNRNPGGPPAPGRDGAIGKDANLPNGDSRTRAVALRYEHARGAPSVVAKGSGVVADEILRRAEEAGVFVHKSRELVSMLMQVDLDTRVPPALYTAVAEILAWVYRQDERVAQRLGPIPGAPGGSAPGGSVPPAGPALPSLSKPAPALKPKAPNTTKR